MHLHNTQSARSSWWAKGGGPAQGTSRLTALFLVDTAVRMTSMEVFLARARASKNGRLGGAFLKQGSPHQSTACLAVGPPGTVDPFPEQPSWPVQSMHYAHAGNRHRNDMGPPGWSSTQFGHGFSYGPTCGYGGPTTIASPSSACLWPGGSVTKKLTKIINYAAGGVYRDLHYPAKNILRRVVTQTLQGQVEKGRGYAISDRNSWQEQRKPPETSRHPLHRDRRRCNPHSSSDA